MKRETKKIQKIYEEFKGLSVKETISKLHNNGTINCFDTKKKCYFKPQEVNQREVKRILCYDGFGYAQVNVILYI